MSDAVDTAVSAEVEPVIVWLLCFFTRGLNGRDVDLAGDANRTINRCRDALVAVSPALERVIGVRLTQPGVRDVLTKFPTPSTLRSAGKTRIGTAIKRRSPRLAGKLADEIWAALDAPSVVLPFSTTFTGRTVPSISDRHS